MTQASAPKILVDECLPVKMVEWLRGAGFQACSVSHMGWSGRKDADILTLAEREGFTVLLTADANMKDQHKFAHRPLAVLALPVNRLQTVGGILPQVFDTLKNLAAGTFNVMDFSSAADWPRATPAGETRSAGVTYLKFK
ncbi:MAG: DUF5615 family PIN-like protein [Alphaproteobacteria bacterium]|nr:DUF5615 family PIN-like protein [Alphaproteobacteria bacterium]